MHPNEPTNNKLDSYIRNESQAQFSDEKREEVEETKLGKSKFSVGLVENFNGSKTISAEDLEKLAKLKNQTVLVCSICGRGFLARNSRGNSFPLCPQHINQKSLGERVAKGLGFNKKVDTLDYLRRTRTTSVGPYFKPTT